MYLNTNTNTLNVFKYKYKYNLPFSKVFRYKYKHLENFQIQMQIPLLLFHKYLETNANILQIHVKILSQVNYNQKLNLYNQKINLLSILNLLSTTLKQYLITHLSVIQQTISVVLIIFFGNMNIYLIKICCTIPSELYSLKNHYIKLATSVVLNHIVPRHNITARCHSEDSRN